MLYWILQSLGWSLYALVNYGVISNKGLAPQQALLNVLTISVVGLLLSHWLRAAFRKPFWQGLTMFQTLLFSLVLLLLTTVVWETLIVLTLWLWLPDFSWEALNGLVLLFYYGNYFIVLLIWTLLYKSYHNYRSRQQKEIETLKLQLALRESQLQGLKFQMNPHFLFNALNSIRSLALDSPQATRDMVTQLAGMLRYTLGCGEQKLVALQAEIEIIEHYLAIEKVRFEQRLQVEWQIESGMEQVQVQPLSLQTLVENAVKYGIATQPAGGVISINISTKITTKGLKYLVVEISNVGLLPITINDSIGLNNTKQRLALQFGQAAHFSLTQVQDRVVARLQIPVLIDQECVTGAPL